VKKALFILIVIVLLYIINSLAHSIYGLWHKQDLLASAKAELEAEKLKNQKLKADYSYAQTNQFVEEQAYNKLFLVKEGEQKVLFSKNLTQKTEIKKVTSNTPNWKKWLDLFF
jgi:cell division protein FtsB